MFSFKNTYPYEAYAHHSQPIQAAGMLWIEYSSRAYIRFPLFRLDTPSKESLKEVFKKSPARMITYATESPEENKNGYIYLCRAFNTQTLKDNYKRNIKKAATHFEIKKLTAAEIEEQGFQAYSDTRKRLGLNDFTKDDFLKRFASHNARANNVYICAIHDNAIAAFASVLCYHDFIEIEGLFSCNDALNDRPNDYIIYTILDVALNQDKLNGVSYGYSSIQEDSNEEGLHRFKVKCGFEALPLRRHFIFSPAWRMIFNPLTKQLVRLLLKRYPSHLTLRKLHGILRYS